MPDSMRILDFGFAILEEEKKTDEISDLSHVCSWGLCLRLSTRRCDVAIQQQTISGFSVNHIPIGEFFHGTKQYG